MSFILDALKKSESARQRQAGPSLFEVKVAAPKRGLPTWAIVLGALLLINVAVFGWVLLRRPAGRAAAVASAKSGTGAMPVQALPPAAAGSAARTPGPVASSPGGTQGIPAASPASARQAPAAASGGTAPGAAGSSPGGGPGPQGEAMPAQSAAGAAPGGVAPEPDADSADFAPAIQPPAQGGPGARQTGVGLPRYQDLAATPGVSLPRLHLDLHVYDANPRKRYVMINMQTLRQGDSLPDGVTVVSIRPDGVVLSYEGRQFLLAR